jgi:PBP1b-binding outer membrane lipoprotein LpoB
MKQILSIFVVALVLTACGNETGTKLEDPSNTHPPAAAIPDSMQIVQDSVIVPDTAPGGGAQGDTHQHQ